MAKPVKVFIHDSCGPCSEIKQLIESGQFNLDEVEVLDLSTKEGFPWLDKLSLTKVPSAYAGTRACRLLLNEDRSYLTIDCPKDNEE